MNSKNYTYFFKRLAELASCKNFANILAYIRYLEYNPKEGLVEHSLAQIDKRLTTTEIQLLVGMWLHSYNPQSTVYLDVDETIQEIYSLLKQIFDLEFKNKESDNYRVRQLAFYEGDEAYDYQFAELAEYKYSEGEISETLHSEYGYYENHLLSTFNKIKSVLHHQRVERLKGKKAKNEYVSPLNLFVLKPNTVNKRFSLEEKKIIESLSFELGKDVALPITDVASQNSFTQKPIVKLPNNRGYLFIDYLSIAIAMYEAPYYWLVNNHAVSSKHFGTIRGKLSENLVYAVLRKKFQGNSIERNLKVRKAKTGNDLTDIDILLHYNNVCIIFQIKSKRLNEQSKRGDNESIEEDFEKAFYNAYKQGCRSVECLKDFKNYYSLRNINYIDEQTKFYNICVTTERYPSATFTGYIKAIDNNLDVEFLPLKIFDLDIILSWFSADDTISYIHRRAEYCRLNIFGQTEAYYIGAFICEMIGAIPILQPNTIIQRQCAIFLDLIRFTIDNRRHNVCCINDITDLLQKYAIKEVEKLFSTYII